MQKPFHLPFWISRRNSVSAYILAKTSVIALDLSPSQGFRALGRSIDTLIRRPLYAEQSYYISPLKDLSFDRLNLACRRGDFSRHRQAYRQLGDRALSILCIWVCAFRQRRPCLPAGLPYQTARGTDDVRVLVRESAVFPLAGSPIPCPPGRPVADCLQ